MNFTNSVTTCLTKYATFSGRATRSEYWWFILFCIVVQFAVAAVAGQDHPLSLLANLALFLPGLAAGSRRLHDTGRTAWWLLLFLVPIVGWIILLIFFVESSKAEGAKYETATHDQTEKTDDDGPARLSD